MNPEFFNIGNHLIDGKRVFIIAEIGNNHNGSLSLAKQLIDRAIEAGVDSVKFQIRNRKALYRTKADGSSSEDLGVEYIQDLLNKVELTLEEHKELRQYCKERKILYICTPWDEPSVDTLAEFDVAAIKLASADLFNPYLIEKASKLGKPMILSTGMAYDEEIVQAAKQLTSLSASFALLHCNSAYPAPDIDIQLNYLARLKQIHNVIGYSGHERGIPISLAAVALGAMIIERHITLDRNMEGPDHLASLEPTEFKQLVDGIRQLELALPWQGPGRNPSQGELLNRENLSKSVIAQKDISEGEVFSFDMFRVASPGQGLAPYKLKFLLGKTANRKFSTGDFLFDSDMVDKQNQNLDFKFPNQWGVPVRYHDFNQYNDKISPDLFEFHLSYRDLNVNPKEFLSEVNCTRLVVHAPELFENSELLDLVSDNLDYRRRSIENLQRVIVATEQIGEFFPQADSLLIVANIGGFSADEPLPFESRIHLYKLFQESLSYLNFGKTELIPQNMAPFPWHFGGQRHQNIFMMPDELKVQSQLLNIRLCLDLSHLQMTCHNFGLDFQVALESLLPHTAHLHISDAKGKNGEGVIMGTGDIEWSKTWQKIIQYPNISFIPEVWQGHKDHGAGFWSALQFLKKL